MGYYTESFFQGCAAVSRESAEHVVPLIMQLLSPQSVVDVGCGTGTWLSVFQEQGAKEILGIDGDYVRPDQLRFPHAHFFAHDLTQPLVLPPERRQVFDLVVSLEVAEHLPETSAQQFVSTLVSLGPAILFSAAIPFQGGTHHVNEQWPNYWAKLFQQKGYQTVDWLRPQIWGNPHVAFHYAQNSLLFLKSDELDRHPQLHNDIVAADDPALARVHPVRWLEANNVRSQPLKKVLTALPFSVLHAATRRLNRLGKKT